ncbi:putative quinol monooxygenase [Glacieibacterium frigidum]|uniref:Antibiotic biosynthesis monooxygenase n=1 Tax=Glacieibacterium frigidum TaxID=2593303 RepID=A0A552UF17_9SPHN|nr:putative quinol monooxygenase [Glacieibacterium frigidum]TRW16769.1 antibiotic biosynthesis monooxygenase [Glacieibacterium frigidum]
MIIVIGRAEVDPADIARLRPALDAMMRATWEESGCLSYSMAVEGDSVVTIVERWADEAALKAHFATPHMAAFNAQIKGAVRSMDLKMYDVTGERSLTI